MPVIYDYETQKVIGEIAEMSELDEWLTKHGMREVTRSAVSCGGEPAWIDVAPAKPISVIIVDPLGSVLDRVSDVTHLGRWLEEHGSKEMDRYYSCGGQLIVEVGVA